MNIHSAILWGFASTVILTTLLNIGRSLNLTRMDIPFLLGTMLTSDRHRAKFLGFFMHFIIGWVFAFIYVLVLEDTGLKHWWFGIIIAIVHATFVLTVGMKLITTFHPRMATEDQGPDPTKQLEPPGFMILNYGRGTPIATYVSHIIYGFVIGFFYN